MYIYIYVCIAKVFQGLPATSFVCATCAALLLDMTMNGNMFVRPECTLSQSAQRRARYEKNIATRNHGSSGSHDI